MLWTIVGIAIGVLAVILIAVAIYNAIIGAKCKKLEQKEIQEKETALKRKLGKLPPEDEVQPEEPTEEVKEETEEPKEEEKEPEVNEEPKEEVQPVEEKKEEPKKVEKPKKEKKAKEPKKVEEKKEEPKEEVNDAEELLKDVPDAKDNEVEEKVEEPKEEVKEEPKEEVKEEPVVAPAPKKAPAKKATKKTAVAQKKEEPKKEEPKKEEPKKEEVAEDKDAADGKWILIGDKDGYYYAELKANNGQLLLTTEKYKGVTGIKGGIETIKKNLVKDNYEISVDKNNTANFKLFGSNASLLCIGEGYTSKENAESAINSVKNFATSPIIVSEEIDETENKKYEIASANKNDGGKWIIVDTKDGYLHAELKANNGQVLLVTENYKGINSLNSGLESIRKNINNGNFGVKKDKNDNYNFKLFSENKRLLALGAGYSSLASCESAINSVMKFNDSQLINNLED